MSDTALDTINELVQRMGILCGQLTEEDERLLCELLEVVETIQLCCEKDLIKRVMLSNNAKLIRKLLMVLSLDFGIDVEQLLIVKSQLQTLRTTAVKTQKPAR